MFGHRFGDGECDLGATIREARPSDMNVVAAGLFRVGADRDPALVAAIVHLSDQSSSKGAPAVGGNVHDNGAVPVCGLT